MNMPIYPSGISYDMDMTLEIHSCPKLKLQPLLSFSSFVHNSSINEQNNMKLRENISYEMIN